MKDFPRPKPVDVAIFGENHALHRLSHDDVTLLTDTLAESIEGGIKTLMGRKVPVPEAVKTALTLGGPALRTLLRISFPTFQEWENLPLRYEITLLDIVWDENDMTGIIEDFFALAGKMAKSSKKILTLNLKS